MNTTIMDVTLRDGSYEVNFSFTQDDVQRIGNAVQKAGIQYMEIGHGQGLNASSPQHGIATCTDEEYLSAVAESLTGIKYGLFCIPGIARIKDLDLLKAYGASFVRVGCNTEIKAVEETKGFITHAKKLGLEVFANYMKTYVADEYEFEECVKRSYEYGADCLVIVDSAGCMLPRDIKKYYDIIRQKTDNIKVGFHGHDNLGLSVSNSLYALQIGCDIVDTSLQSLGRGAGNASTEQLIAILNRIVPECDYKLCELMHFSEDYLRHRVKYKGVSGLDTYCGIAGFHSGFMNSIKNVSADYDLDPFDLIVSYCKIDRKNMNETILKSIAETLKNGQIYSKK